MPLSEIEWRARGYQFYASRKDKKEADLIAKDMRKQGWSARVDFRYGSGTYFLWIAVKSHKKCSRRR